MQTHAYCVVGIHAYYANAYNVCGLYDWNSVNWHLNFKLVHFMDTDDLSRKAYNGILIEAEQFPHDLTLNFGLLADRCKDDAEYLVESRILIGKLKKVKPSDYPDVFFGEMVDPVGLYQTLDRMLKNIDRMEGVLVPMSNSQTETVQKSVSKKMI